MKLTHGHSHPRSPTYNSWRAMVARCEYEPHPFYPDYGGRGIRIAPALRTFAGFLEQLGERPAGMTLERIDVEGDYAPGNVRWATRIEQRWNRRDMLERAQMELAYA